jgi:hypothetical protein
MYVKDQEIKEMYRWTAHANDCKNAGAQNK